MGPQGSGKGTQLGLLASVLKKTDPDTGVEIFQTGDLFRTLMKGDTWTTEKVGTIQNAGMLQPLFLTIALWGNEFIARNNPSAHILIDGFPRRFREAEIVAGALSFYERKNVEIVVIEVSEEMVRERMSLRNRGDDSEESMTKRLGLYEEHTMPCIAYFETEGYAVHRINGAQTVEEVQKAILTALKLS